MNTILLVRVMWAFLFILSQVSSAPTQRDDDESWPLEPFYWTGNVKTSSNIFTQEMNKYWMDKEYFCGSSSEEMLFDICRMYYYGQLSPFRDENFNSGPLDGRKKRDITEECCKKPCSRWVIKQECKTNPSIYHPSKPRPSTTTSTTLRPTATTQISIMDIPGVYQCIVFSSFCPLCLINCY